MKIEEIINIQDGADFARIAEQFLRGEFEVKEFKALTDRLFSLRLRQDLESVNYDTSDICVLVRDLLLELTVDAGSLPEIADLTVYNLFVNAKKLQSLDKISTTIQSLQSVFDSEGIGELEKLYMLILEFYLGVLNGESKVAFDLFIRRLSTIHIHDIRTILDHVVINNLFEQLGVRPEQFMAALRPIFAKDIYFALSKTQRRSVFNWCLHYFWQYAPLFSHSLWPAMYEDWKEILYGHINLDECDQVMYVQFFIYHVMGNSYQTQLEWREFNEAISRKTAAYYADWGIRNNIAKCANEQRSAGKKLIGMVRDRVVMNSPMQVEYSVFKKLMADDEFKSKYELVIYNMDYVEKSDTDTEVVKMLSEIGIKVINVHNHLYSAGYYFSHLEKAILIRDKIISDGVDIMIIGSAGYDIHDFMMSNRTAPKQIVWIHGNFEYDVPNIDKRITHIPVSTHQKQSDYIVEHFEYQTDEMFTKPEEELNKHKASTVRQKFPTNTVILGSIGRLVKMDNYGYLKAVSEIMKECQNTIYLACGGGNIDSVKEKAIEVGIPMDRFLFEGFVDPHVYGYVIDVYLNTFPEAGGEAVTEFLEKNKYKLYVGYNYNENLFGVCPKQSYVFDAVDYCTIIDNLGKEEYLSRFETSNRNFVFQPHKEKFISLKKKALEIKEKFESSIILGSVCSFRKITDVNFLNAVKEILLQNQESIYVLYGYGEDQHIRIFVEKNNLTNKFFIFKYQDFHVANLAIDIILNPFPYGCGILYDNIDEDKIIISLENE